MTANATHAQAWVALALWGLSARQLARLLRAFGSPEAVLDASALQLARHLSASSVSRIKDAPNPATLEKTMAWLTGDGHQLVTWGDGDYPQTLLALDDAPPVLFFVGDREILRRPALAIVGSRNATPQGLDNARAFAETLSQAGVAIISGMALGIDGAAHEGGLRGRGSSLAVIGTGPDRIYPARHRDLAHRLAERGGILSEFLPGTPPLRENFPRRNRLISGLAHGVLIVEASLSSGSLITARLAGEQGREVFAIPGSIHSPFSKGCHKLIREGAKLVETAQDILDELPILRAASATQKTHETSSATKSDTTVAAQIRDFPENDGVEAALLVALGYDPVDLDTLVKRSTLPAEKLLAVLTELELAGRISSLAGGKWIRR
ncbi:MAG: DNA-processing protein DprA [Burkholderiales bacterium]|jgi:DNA processing protein|nr:DNA-processing protein DprA [Burkholderiales bacterium]